MNTNELLVDGFGRIRNVVHSVVGGLTAEQLAHRVDRDANSIAWLVWHLTRIQDDHIADVAGIEQIWTAQDWAGRFALPFDVSATGYGHTSAEVGSVRVASGTLLTGYHDAVYDQTVRYIEGLDMTPSGGISVLDRIVDESWDPPVSLGVRLVSVISDDLQHAGQAAYVRGLAERARG
ncbi:MAG: mycothiol transferase [Acidimicrobiia bacterium]